MPSESEDFGNQQQWSKTSDPIWFQRSSFRKNKRLGVQRLFDFVWSANLLEVEELNGRRRTDATAVAIYTYTAHARNSLGDDDMALYCSSEWLLFFFLHAEIFLLEFVRTSFVGLTGLLLTVSVFFLSSVSNEVPEHPVLSPVSGCVFERRLIEKYIGETGNDPVNRQPLTLEQLIDIKSKLLYGHKLGAGTGLAFMALDNSCHWSALWLCIHLLVHVL